MKTYVFENKLGEQVLMSEKEMLDSRSEYDNVNILRIPEIDENKAYFLKEVKHT